METMATLPVEDYDQMELETLRNKLAHSEEQADRGEYAESNLESMLEKLKKKRSLFNV